MKKASYKTIFFSIRTFICAF